MKHNITHLCITSLSTWYRPQSKIKPMWSAYIRITWFSSRTKWYGTIFCNCCNQVSWSQSKNLVAKIDKNRDFDQFRLFSGTKRPENMATGSHDLYASESTSDIPVNKVSGSHSNTFWENWSKQNCDLFRPVSGPKGPENMVHGRHSLHTLECICDMPVHQV